ncbi:PDDEXK nuclease domain-containing protein [Pseudomonas luteola]|uniref:PDDEXK nuclease domain-containing protein n=1 Tax=Pseudomonas luteola TaxID=47886 RepID=UPI003A850059
MERKGRGNFEQDTTSTRGDGDADGRVSYFENITLGQLSFYMTAVDRQVRSELDGPTIGLLLCKSKNQVVAEYALGDNTQPMGIAEYKLSESLPVNFQTSLPSIEQIEQELAGVAGKTDDEG